MTDRTDRILKASGDYTAAVRIAEDAEAAAEAAWAAVDRAWATYNAAAEAVDREERS